MNATEALKKLIDGHKRFMENAPAKKETNEAIRKSLASGQHPYAVIVTCSDSRDSPELIFDASFDEIFVIRNAGNVVTDVELASIEYAIAHLHVPLVVVMGHGQCGAVQATLETMESGRECEGHFSSIYNEIMPSIMKHKGQANCVSLAEYDNITHSAEKITQCSIIKSSIEKGLVEVKRSRYQIESGEVEFF